MGTDRRYKTLGLETEGFITHGNSGNQSVTFSCSHLLGPSFYGMIWRWQGEICICNGLCYRRETLILGNPNLLWWTVSKHVLEEDTLFFLSCSLYRHPWILSANFSLGQEDFQIPLLIRCRNMRDPWTVVFQQIALIDVVSIIDHDNIGDDYLLSFPNLKIRFFSCLLNLILI